MTSASSARRRSMPTPDAAQTRDYALSMLRGLAEMAARVGLAALAHDLVLIAEKHAAPPPRVDGTH